MAHWESGGQDPPPIRAYVVSCGSENSVVDQLTSLPGARVPCPHAVDVDGVRGAGAPLLNSANGARGPGSGSSLTADGDVDRHGSPRALIAGIELELHGVGAGADLAALVVAGVPHDLMGAVGEVAVQ